MTKLQTDWKNVVREGQTIDGRDVSRIDIEQMAKHYSRDIKEAVMNYNHVRPIWNLGAVVEVRAIEDEQGKMRLQARLEPNLDCYRLNKESQAIYFSVEIHRKLEEFNNEAYLYGLALTDEPASLGTSKLELFSANGGGSASDWEEFTLLDADALQPAIEKTGFFSKMFNKSKGDEMTEEQMTKLSGMIAEGLGGVIAPVQEALEKLSTVSSDEEKPPKVDENKSGEDSEEVTKLKGKVEELSTQISGLVEEFKAPNSRQTDPSDEPKGGDDSAARLHF